MDLSNVSMYFGRLEYGCGDNLIFRIDFLTEAQEAKVMSIVQERIRQIWVPLPVCGGDCCPEEGWAYAQFDTFTIDYFEGILSIQFPPLCESGDPELLIDLDMDPHNPDPEKELEHGWTRFLPAKDLLREILEAA